MSLYSSDHVNVSALPVNTGVDSLPKVVTMPEGVSPVSTWLWTKDINWTVSDYNSSFTDCFSVSRLNAIFYDGHHEFIYDQQGIKRDTAIEGWNRRW